MVFVFLIFVSFSSPIGLVIVSLLNFLRPHFIFSPRYLAPTTDVAHTTATIRQYLFLLVDIQIRSTGWPTRTPLTAVQMRGFLFYFLLKKKKVKSKVKWEVGETMGDRLGLCVPLSRCKHRSGGSSSPVGAGPATGCFCYKSQGEGGRGASNYLDRLLSVCCSVRVRRWVRIRWPLSRLFRIVSLISFQIKKIPSYLGHRRYVQLV